MNGRIVDLDGFVARNTAVLTAPLVPEVRLHLASEAVPLWQLTEEEMAAKGLPPPYWAFAWAGGQALARYVLDHPETVRGKRVLDFATGSGLVAIAAALAGAAEVRASDIDRFAIAATRANAALNGVSVTCSADDLVGSTLTGVDLVLAADICYEQPTAGRVLGWFRSLAAAGLPVLLGDPGRTYRPRDGVERLAHYAVPTTRELEDKDVRSTDVWRVLAGEGA
ncbi:MAG: 50S ribosomal protein L11 methyltransferase [Pseudomonadota bacterium]|nr:50S ribosomal protein L11 methyltransferase [Pseudomonadota bacterium]